MRQNQQQNYIIQNTLPLNPPTKHDKLLKILSKNKNRGVSLEQQKKSSDNSDHNLNININSKDSKSSRQILKLVRERLENITQQQNKMNKTNFMISYMDKLKKQRKRQEKKKLKSFNSKQQISNTKSNSVYIFLPNVVKQIQEQEVNTSSGMINISKQVNNDNQKLLKTINLFQNRNIFVNRSIKKRTYSFDQRNRFSSKKIQKQTYEQKVNQIIQEIKKHRTKPSKYLSVVDSKTNQIFYFKNSAKNLQKTKFQCQQSQSSSTYPYCNSEQQNKIQFPVLKPNERTLNQKRKIRHARMPTNDNKQLEPWSTARDIDQLDYHPIYQTYSKDDVFEFY